MKRAIEIYRQFAVRHGDSSGADHLVRTAMRILLIVAVWLVGVLTMLVLAAAIAMASVVG